MLPPRRNTMVTGYPGRAAAAQANRILRELSKELTLPFAEAEDPSTGEQARPGASLPDGSRIVRFAELIDSPRARQAVENRLFAVKLLKANLHLGKEAAIQLVCRSIRDSNPHFAVSPSSLYRWLKKHEAYGVDGLVEQKRGRVGRRGRNQAPKVNPASSSSGS